MGVFMGYIDFFGHGWTWITQNRAWHYFLGFYTYNEGFQKGPKKVPKWSQITKNLIFELETWDSHQKSIFMIDERIWTQNCLKCTLRCPEKVQKGPKWVQNGSKKGPKSVFWARDLRFTPDIYFYDWWKDPKRVQKCQISSFWARDLRFISEVCFYDWWKDLESKLPKGYSNNVISDVEFCEKTFLIHCNIFIYALW